jgi:hypothetical protein
MASYTAETLILQHPSNPIHNPMLVTDTDKAWARQYDPIKNITLHSLVDQDGITQANFEEAFFPLSNDDRMRFRRPAVPPNNRSWRLQAEADCENWFNTEIVNVVLAAWDTSPTMIQSSHNKPLSDRNIPEEVDSLFSVKLGDRRRPVVIGEIARNLIREEAWRRGRPSAIPNQKRLSQELRGCVSQHGSTGLSALTMFNRYAHKYQCPQVFCFDGSFLLLLQFRASRVEDLQDENCPVDCWILPVTGSSCPLRYALYRLISQGWRRCQTEIQPSFDFTVGGLQPHSRNFFNGEPIWQYQGSLYIAHPFGYERLTNGETGALMWTHRDYEGEWETDAFW